jgi:hypothetical protein
VRNGPYCVHLCVHLCAMDRSVFTCVCARELVLVHLCVCVLFKERAFVACACR